jgi:hypothetical protein
MPRLIGVLKEHEAGADVIPQPTQMRQRSGRTERGVVKQRA